jgi:Curli production assembly/transport component CsgG
LSNSLRLFLAILAGLVVTTCAPPVDTRYVKDGKSYGTTSDLFNEMWYNYYQRALSFADGDFWPEAQRDLTTAIALRNREQRRARTYGMHFIDYFPHRELGIALFRQDKLQDAERELEFSLQQVDSAKAHYFLAQVRGNILQRSGKDISPPVITLSSNSATIYTASAENTLQGMLSDDTAISAVSINGESIYIRQPAATVPFDRQVKLQTGTNRFDIEATDLVGNSTLMQASMVLDMQGPFIALNPPRRDGNHWIISGTVQDDWKLSYLQVGGEVLTSLPHDGSFSCKVEQADGRIIVEANDLAGNITRSEIELGKSQRMGKSSEWRQYPSGTMLAALQPAEFVTIELTKIPPAVVTSPFVTLHLELTCESSFKRIAIAGKPVSGMPKRARLAFSHVVSLNEGDNDIEIYAQSAKGNVHQKTVSIQRRKHCDDLHDYCLRLAFYSSSQFQGGDAAAVFNSRFETQLDQRDRFILLSRDKLERILLERKLSLSGLADKRYASKINELQVADFLITGLVSSRESGIEAMAKLLNAKTSEVEYTVDVFHENSDEKTLLMLARALGVEVENRFPQVRGKIIEIGKGGKAFYIDCGKQQGLRSGLPMVVFEESAFEFKNIGFAHITKLGDDRSLVVLDDDSIKESIHIGLEVGTR